MVIAIVIVLLVIGSVAFHFISPWYLTPLASNWSTIDDTINVTFWVTGFVFVAINLFMALAIWRFRYNKNRLAHYEPENKKLEGWLTGVTSLGIAAMLAPGLWVWAEFVNVPDNAANVEVVGQQWHWSYRFPGADNKLGAVDARYITDDNPFGMDPEDPHGLDDRLVSYPELHLPLDQPVKLLLRSKDVLHNFTVAQFRVKMDLVPGLVSYLWLTPTRTGRFDVLCEELCGVGHFVMRGSVVVDEQEEFERWLGQQPTFADTQSNQLGDAVAGRAQYAVCGACHGMQGEGNPALNAPKLAGQEDWYMRRQIQHFKSGSRGAHPDDVYGQQMAAMANVLFSDSAVNNVIAHIGSFPDLPAPITVSGDVKKGEKIYQVCANCHGYNAEGIKALNAPRQAGMSDWYLVTQLKNFKAEIRGEQPNDYYGQQMAAMAKILRNDETINNVVAYINTLNTDKSQLAWIPTGEALNVDN